MFQKAYSSPGTSPKADHRGHRVTTLGGAVGVGFTSVKTAVVLSGGVQVDGHLDYWPFTNLETYDACGRPMRYSGSVPKFAKDYGTELYVEDRPQANPDPSVASTYLTVEELPATDQPPYHGPATAETARLVAAVRADLWGGGEALGLPGGTGGLTGAFGARGDHRPDVVPPAEIEVGREQQEDSYDWELRSGDWVASGGGHWRCEGG